MAKPKKTPRISVNKLAEYLEATSIRRKRIVEDAKDPKKFVVTRYRDARAATKQYLSGEHSEDAILEIIDELEDRDYETEFQQQDLKLSAEALESMLEADISLSDGCEFLSADENNHLINISGVDISVNPDLIVKKKNGDNTLVGAVKLHISKTSRLSEESQNIVAVMLYNYVEAFVASADKGELANPKLCMSFDIFNSRLMNCPTSYKLRMKKIAAACEEIALWWDSL